MFNPILGYVGSVALTAIALFMTWFILKKSAGVAQLGAKGAIEVILVGVVVYYAASKLLVPAVDSSYAKDIKPQVQRSQILKDVAGAIGASEQMGFKGNIVVPTQDVAAIGPTNTQSGSVAVAPQQTTNQTVTQAQYPSYFTATTAKLVEGGKKDVCGWMNQTSLIVCDNADKPGGETLSLDQVSNRGALPQPQTVVVVQPTAIPQPTAVPVPVITRDEWYQKMGACWMVWANSVDLSNSTAKWGALMLPFGTVWELTGPNQWNSWWTPDGKETWHLSQDQMGIYRFPVKGPTGRSIPGHKEGSAMVKGQGTDFAPACGLPLSPPPMAP